MPSFGQLLRSPQHRLRRGRRQDRRGGWQSRLEPMQHIIGEVWVAVDRPLRASTAFIGNLNTRGNRL
jgi:hypothetical protein